VCNNNLGLLELGRKISNLVFDLIFPDLGIVCWGNAICTIHFLLSEGKLSERSAKVCFCSGSEERDILDGVGKIEVM
jgi:hypothetical protein